MKVRVEVSCLATSRPSGVANYTRLLTESLAKQSDVTGSYFNFLNRQPEPTLTDLVAREKNPFVPLRVYAKLDSFNLAWPFDLFKHPVDLTIHPNFARWPSVRSRKIMTVIHDLTYMYYPELVEPKNLNHLRRVVPRAIDTSDYILTVSHAVKAELVREFGISPQKCIVTHIPPSPEFFKQSDVDVHAHYTIPTQKYILCVGNLEPRKNLLTVVQAYRLLPKDIRDTYALVLAGGKGWNFAQTQAEIDKPIDGGYICQVGFVAQDHLPALYQQASLFVMASLYEGFGMPILEALASNTPVLAADTPVLREAGGQVSRYAETTTPSDFAANMIDILTHPDSKFSVQAASHLQQFSWQRNVDAILAIIKNSEERST